jgi:hypothetical protein
MGSNHDAQVDLEAHEGRDSTGKSPSGLHLSATSAHAHARTRTRSNHYLGLLTVELVKQIELEHEITLQVATMMAAGIQKREIITTLGIADVIYEMCAYRLRSIAREWRDG